MNSTRIAIGGLLVLLTLSSGLWLARLGRPFNVPVFNIHKLIALGTVVFFGVSIYGARNGASLPALLVLAAAGALVLALFVSGALLSIGKPDSPAVLKIHQIAPWLAALFAGTAVYLLAANGVG